MFGIKTFPAERFINSEMNKDVSMIGEQEEIKIVQLFLTRISVNSFSLQDYSVVMQIEFNDGAGKEIFRNTNLLDKAQRIADAILSDIVTMEENIHLEFDGEELVGAVNVIFHHYEGIREGLAKFVEEVHTKVGKLKNAKQAEGYINNVRQLQNASLEFYG